MEHIIKIKEYSDKVQINDIKIKFWRKNVDKKPKYQAKIDNLIEKNEKILEKIDSQRQ